MTYDEIETFLVNYNKVIAAMQLACIKRGLSFEGARYTGNGIVEVTGVAWWPRTESFNMAVLDLYDIINRGK